MEITIFNVGHGHCTLVRTDDGRNHLIDCGYHSGIPFRPSEYMRSIGITRLHSLTITNYDQDHIDDLPVLWDLFEDQIESLWRNRTISADQLRALKREGGSVTTAMERLLTIIRDFTADSISSSPSAGTGTSWAYFCNPYSSEFDTTNNLSLIAILTIGDFSILFGGDLERKGWEALMQNPSFRLALRSVKIFVASHHGRENGFHPEVFRFCEPDLIVISDAEILHDTQDHGLYDGQAKGRIVNGRLRRVLTTRTDGHIIINPLPDGRYDLRTALTLPEPALRPEREPWNANQTGMLAPLPSPSRESALMSLSQAYLGMAKARKD